MSLSLAKSDTTVIEIVINCGLGFRFFLLSFANLNLSQVVVSFEVNFSGLSSNIYKWHVIINITDLLILQANVFKWNHINVIPVSQI